MPELKKRKKKEKTFIDKVRQSLNDIVFRSPARIALLAFAGVIFFFTFLLYQPWASNSGKREAFSTALFTAASATTVTGLTNVDTAITWTSHGQAVILAAIQVGGLGIMTIAAILTLAVSRGLGVRGKLLAMDATSANKMGDVAHLLRVIVTTTLSIELSLAVFMFPHFLLRGLSAQDSLWKSIFYSISAFNNAGFCIDAGGLEPYKNDPWFLTLISIGVFIGSLGFPVFLILKFSGWHWRHWNLHTKLTICTTSLLVLLGSVLFFFLESDNAKTFGNMNWWDRWWNAVFASINTRSGGFNLVDINTLRESSHVVSDAFMFVGGGSASTAGGIKVTTFAVLCLAVVAEARGDNDLQAFNRRIPTTTLRQAVSVTFLGTLMVAVCTAWLSHLTATNLDRVLFEVISAFATCGLTVGVSAELPPEGLYMLSALMFAGRVGTITLAAALAIRQNRQLYRNPEERPAIG